MLLIENLCFVCKITLGCRKASSGILFLMLASIKASQMKIKLIMGLGLLSGLLAVWSYADEVALTLLYTTDLHGHISGVTSEHKAELAGGLLRCATLIQEARHQNPDLLLLDGGDLFQGAAESFLTRGAKVMEIVKALGYDALVIGNHEFDWGFANLARLYAQAPMPILASNVKASAGPAAQAFPISPFMLKEVAGARVIVVGLANPATPLWNRPRLLGGLTFEKSLPALRRIMPAVRAQHPDVLVLVAHQGWRKWGDDAANEINAIARAFPEIDVIFGGHTHTPIEGRDLRGAIYIQPGAHGLWLAKVGLQVDRQRHCVTGRTAELISVDSSIAPAADLEKSCAEALLQTRRYLNQEIGQAASALPPASVHPGQSAVQTLLAGAIAEAVQAEVVFHRTLTSATLKAGSIRMRDVWRIMPYENSIAVAQLNLAELREILEENSRYLKTEQFRGVYGITYEIAAPPTPGSRTYRVRDICLASGRKLKATERIKVAFNSHDLASAGGRFPRLRQLVDRPTSRLEETDADVREAVVAYIRAHQPLAEEPAVGARVRRLPGASKALGARAAQSE